MLRLHPEASLPAREQLREGGAKLFAEQVAESQTPFTDRIDDAVFFGVNWDIWDTEELFVQATVARALGMMGEPSGC